MSPTLESLESETVVGDALVVEVPAVCPDDRLLAMIRSGVPTRLDFVPVVEAGRPVGFVPITESEMKLMASQFRPILIPDLAPMVERDGQVIAFGLSLTDVNVVLRGNRSGRLLPAALRLLWKVKRERILRSRILLLGVLPEFRGKGIDAVLRDMRKKGQKI